MKKNHNKLIFLALLGTISLLSSDYLYADEKAYQKIPEVYIIKEGDTLWDISGKFLKDPFQWPEVWENNDYVVNPDLIYPGNKLYLRKLFQQIFPPKKDKKITIIKSVKKKVAKPVLPIKIPVTNLAMLRTSGFIARDDFSIGTIIDSPLERSTLSKGDNVYTDIGPGKNSTLGKKYLIYRMIREVKHPITQEDMGFLVRTIGILEIKKFIGGKSAALITDSYEEITLNDLISDYIELEVPMIDPSLQPKKKDVRGYIINTKDGRTSVGLQDIVYLDVGENKGIVPGDSFVTYKTKDDMPNISTNRVAFQRPAITIGELKIVSTRAETATALVTKSAQELNIGDKVEYKFPGKRE